LTSQDPGKIEPPSAASVDAGSVDAGSPRPPAIFSLEGRRAPALYLVGWLGSLLGLGITVITFLGQRTPATAWILTGGVLLLALGLLAAAGAQAVERAGRTDLAYRGPSPWLVFAAVIALTLLVVVVVVGPLTVLGLDPAGPVATSLALGLTTLVYVGVVRLVVVGPGALTWREMGVPRVSFRALGDVLYGAVFALPVLFVTGLIALVLQQALPPPPSPLPEAVDPLGIVANVVSAVIIAPVGEELFFRGFATTAWARTSPRMRAVARGAVLFALAHVITIFDFEQALYGFLVRLPVGVALGWLLLSRRSLAAPIGLHAAFNGIQVLVVTTAPG